MKKILALCVLCLALPSLVFADLVPYYDPYMAGDVFSSPALLIESAGKTNFAIEVDAKSSIDYLSYQTNPSGQLAKYGDYLKDSLMAADLSFWRANYESVRTAFGFDSENFPSQPTDELSLEEMRLYLEDSFERRFDDAHIASAVRGASSSTDLFAPSSAPDLYGDMALTLMMGGGEVYDNGFGWKVFSNIGFVGSESLLKSDRNLFSFDVRADIGYALHIINERFTIGASLELLAIGQNYIDNNALLSARFDANPIAAFTNDFKFALGFGVDFGSMYRHNENLAFTLDLTNVAAFRKYYDLSLTDFVDFDGFTEDENVYYNPMDLVLRALWNNGPWHVTVELSDVVDQLIWMYEVDDYSFDFFAIPKVAMSYDLSDDLSLGASLGNSELGLSVAYKGLTATLTTMLDKFGLGLKVGWRF